MATQTLTLTKEKPLLTDMPEWVMMVGHKRIGILYFCLNFAETPHRSVSTRLA